jgi:hypothetical protein
MRTHWLERLRETDQKISEAPTMELRRIYEITAAHYRALAKQCPVAVPYQDTDRAWSSDTLAA